MPSATPQTPGRRSVWPVLRTIGRSLVRLPAWALIGMVVVYRWTLSPLIGRHCRFEPSCSVYFIGAVRKYGALRGAVRGILRICRCHPWHPGGYDPP
jgi:putative membrane protein insertion efficiency factor